MKVNYLCEMKVNYLCEMKVNYLCVLKVERPWGLRSWPRINENQIAGCL